MGAPSEPRPDLDTSAKTAVSRDSTAHQTSPGESAPEDTIASSESGQPTAPAPITPMLDVPVTELVGRGSGATRVASTPSTVDNNDTQDIPPLEPLELTLTPGGLLRRRLESSSAPGIHLSDPNLLEKVKWANAPEGQILVRKDAAAVGDGEQGTVEEAVLCAVGTVGPSDRAFLSCSGDFFPGSMYPKANGLGDAKIIGYLRAAPTDNATGYADLWRGYAANAIAVQNAVPNVANNKAGWWTPDGQRGTIRFVHKLFEVAAPDHIAMDGWNVANWPVRPNVVAERDRLAASHNPVWRVSPLPAYNRDDALIHPLNYQAALNGAIITCNFTLRHWHIHSSNKAMFQAVVHSIKIEANPVRVLPSPTKRIADPRQRDDNASPSKKSRAY